MAEQLIDGVPELKPKPTKTPETVKAVWMENAGGGVGALGLSGLAAYWLSGGDWAMVAAWGLSAGITVGCGLTLMRSSIDEAVDRWDFHLMMRDMDKLRKENDLLHVQVKALRRDRDYAESFGAYREARPGAVVLDSNGDPMPSPAAPPVRNDAKRLIQLHFENGIWPAKDASCSRLQWTTTRWTDARDELQRNGIITTQGKKTIVLAQSLDEALAILSDFGGRSV